MNFEPMGLDECNQDVLTVGDRLRLMRDDVSEIIYTWPTLANAGCVFGFGC